MKKVLFVLTVVTSLGASAHQINNEKGHGPSWNWNTLGHAVKAQTNSKNNSVIKGIRGLDGIAGVGECYVSTYIEARCKDEIKKVMVRPAYNDTEIIPAVTKEVTRKILVEPAKIIEEYIPALYENVERRILVEKAHTRWEKGNSTAIQKVIDGDIYCLVEVPERYENIFKKVLKIPSSTKTRAVDAVYKIYNETVIVTPATTRIVKSYPAVYKSVQECVEKNAGRYEWRSILCEQNSTTSVLKSFEEALHTYGYLSANEVDGVINNKTSFAVKSYQISKDLTVDGLVNIETVKSLGIKY